MHARVVAIGVISFLLSIGNAVGQAAPKPDPTITDEEFAELTALLDDAQDRLMGLITGMSDEQWNFRENPDRWSVGECVEHIARSEAALLETIKGLAESSPDPEWYSKTNGKLAVVRQLVPDRRPQGQGGVRAPGELQPTEGWDRREGIEGFYASHGAVRSFVETMDREIKNRTMESAIPQFGSLNMYDWLNLLALHVVRHSKQIVQVQADPNYPSKPETVAAADPNPSVTDEELATLIAEIDKAQDTLLGLITGMNDEQWNFRENPNRWSVAECVEHIVRTERAVLDGIAATMQGPPNPNWYEDTNGKLATVREIAVNRAPGGAGSPFRAPGEVAPSEQWDRAYAFEQFYKTHGEFRAFVETMDREIKNRTFTNPFPQIGVLNCHDWLTLTALHIIRHSQQVAEVLADPNYPS